LDKEEIDETPHFDLLLTINVYIHLDV